MADIASLYDGLFTSPGYEYTYEQQTGKPVDGTRKLPRLLSPFTIRIVLPEMLGESTGVDVNLIGRASQSAEENNSMANQARAAFGLPSVEGGENQLVQIRAAYSAGQYLTGSSSLTERAVLVDATTLADIKYQVERALTIPPLTLLINPTDMSVTYASIQNFSDLTRKGYVFQRWGEEQMSISFSGTTGAFVAGSSSVQNFAPQTNSPNGVQFASKRDSAAFQNFVSLYQIYKNAGYIYDSIGGSSAQLAVGAVAIDYDQMTYVGHIESFAYGYSTDNPNSIQWDMEFKVDKIYDHAESPVVVLPESSPSVSTGSYTLEEAAREISRTPQQSSMGATGEVFGINVTGLQQYAETPLQALVPSGLVE